MLRLPASRALSASSPLLSISSRLSSRGASLAPASRLCVAQKQQSRHQHAISNPTLANIEKRWEELPPAEQAELWMALRDRMKVDWHQLTLQEKRASYWIAFGPHGPRALPDPNDKWYILRIITYSLIASSIIFGTIRYFARPPPKTMTAEWQEMTNEYLKRQKTEAITGVSSEGYVGKGMVQSKPSGKDPKAADEEEE